MDVHVLHFLAAFTLFFTINEENFIWDLLTGAQQLSRSLNSIISSILKLIFQILPLDQEFLRSFSGSCFLYERRRWRHLVGARSGLGLCRHKNIEIKSLNDQFTKMLRRWRYCNGNRPQLFVYIAVWNLNLQYSTVQDKSNIPVATKPRRKKVRIDLCL